MSQQSHVLSNVVFRQQRLKQFYQNVSKLKYDNSPNICTISVLQPPPQQKKTNALFVPFPRNGLSKVDEYEYNSVLKQEVNKTSRADLINKFAQEVYIDDEFVEQLQPQPHQTLHLSAFQHGFHEERPMSPFQQRTVITSNSRCTYNLPASRMKQVEPRPYLRETKSQQRTRRFLQAKDLPIVIQGETVGRTTNLIDIARRLH